MDHNARHYRQDTTGSLMSWPENVHTVFFVFSINASAVKPHKSQLQKSLYVTCNVYKKAYKMPTPYKKKLRTQQVPVKSAHCNGDTYNA